MSQSSIESAVAEGSNTLAQSGINDTRKEALTILAGLMRVQVPDLWLGRESSLSAEILTQYRSAIERRAKGEPLAYVVGSIGFRFLELQVDARVLIPRPETEGLVDRVLAWGENRSGALRIPWGIAADVGTGSGCIALSLATEGGFERVIATDTSRGAIAVAERNRAVVDPHTPVEFRRGESLHPLGGTNLDAIVSNPPYVSNAEYENLEPGVRAFEPKDALVSGDNGMAHIRSLLSDARALLTNGGLLAIEVDSSRALTALDLAERLGWSNARIEEDLFGRPRYLLTTKES